MRINGVYKQASIERQTYQAMVRKRTPGGPGIVGGTNVVIKSENQLH